MPKSIIIPSKQKCTLVVTEKTHDVVAHHALKHNITLQEATQELLDAGVVKLYGINTLQFLERERN